MDLPSRAASLHAHHRRKREKQGELAHIRDVYFRRVDDNAPSYSLGHDDRVGRGERGLGHEHCRSTDSESDMGHHDATAYRNAGLPQGAFDVRSDADVSGIDRQARRNREARSPVPERICCQFLDVRVVRGVAEGASEVEVPCVYRQHQTLQRRP